MVRPGPAPRPACRAPPADRQLHRAPARYRQRLRRHPSGELRAFPARRGRAASGQDQSMSHAPSRAGRAWLFNALTTVVLWGIWGAFSGLSPERGFPETLVYCVWALTMIPPALIVLAQAGWKLDRSARAIVYGVAVGALGAGGQMVLFYAVTRGPAYLIFPVISLSPVVTIALSFLIMGERTGRLGALGILLALLALPTFDFAPGGDAHGGSWL